MTAQCIESASYERREGRAWRGRRAVIAWYRHTSGILLLATACVPAEPGEYPADFAVPAAAPAASARFALSNDAEATNHGAHSSDSQRTGHAAHAAHVAHGGHGAAEVASEARLAIEHFGGREVVLTIGPIRLAAAADGMVMRESPALQAPVPSDAWLVGLTFQLVSETGTLLPRELLHHINLIRPARRDLFQPTMQRLAAAGRETDGISLPWPFGIRILRDEPLMAIAMLHNTEAHDYGNVYVRVRLELRSRGRVGVQPFMMDVIPPPALASWDLPPGRSVRSWEGSPAIDGRLLGVGGHLHRYGRELILEDVATGRVLHRSEPLLAEDGDVASVPAALFRPAGIRLHAGRRYRVTAVYDNPTAATIESGAMGVFGGVFLPLAAWPAADTTAPLYREDLSARLRH